MMNDIFVTDKTSIHVFEGDELVDIYTKETGVPKIHIEEDGLDKEWAKNRNREIEKEVDILREQNRFFTTHYPDIDREHIEVIEDRIKDLLEERDKNTRKYGLAGSLFNDKYDYEQEKKSIEESLEEIKSYIGSAWINALKSVVTFNPSVDLEDYHKVNDDEIAGSQLLMRDDGADTDGDISEESYRPNWQGAEFNRITSEMLELYSRKNSDYGNSFDQSLDEDGLLVAKIRLKDKLNRFSQLINNDGLVEDESIRDTLIDLANYSVMTLMWIDEQENR